MPYAETLVVTKIDDKLFDVALDVVDPLCPGSDRIAKFLIHEDARQAAHAWNQHNELIALAEQFQLHLANLGDLAPDLVGVQQRVNAVLVKHFEFIEG